MNYGHIDVQIMEILEMTNFKRCIAKIIAVSPIHGSCNKNNNNIKNITFNDFIENKPIFFIKKKPCNDIQLMKDQITSCEIFKKFKIFKDFDDN
jgi:hypothetical protein